MNQFHLHLNKKQLPTMYKNNSGLIAKTKVNKFNKRSVFN